jgi:hypothetical protein
MWNPEAGKNERLLSYDRINGIKTFFSSHGKDLNDWTYRYEFDDVSPEVDASKELQKSDDHWNDGVKKDMVHYAHIPDSILLKWHTEGVNINNPKALIEKVNQRDWRYLKCVDKLHVARG